MRGRQHPKRMEALERIVGREHVERGVAVGDVVLPGVPATLVRPASADEVAAVVMCCYERGVAIVPVGGRSGLAGGAAVLDRDAVAVSLERLDAVRSLEPGLWRMEAEAGVTTATIARRARESGLYFPPDPGAPEQSQLGGTIATNAGGPHAFKYGVTGDWVTGIEAVLAPGELVRVGGPLRKDVAGYDLRALLTGSEGTLGIVTAAWLRLAPAPEAQLAVVAAYPDTATGCAALLRVLASGIVPAALEFFDEGAIRAAGAAFPGGALRGFVVVAEADGSAQEAARVREELREALAPDAVALHTPADRAARAIWRWRDGVALAVTAARGAKLSEDIAVPVDRLAEAIAQTVRIGARHGLEACSWGHAGDGNLHATFLLDPDDAAQRERADAAAQELFELALRLGGSVTGEHGIGVLKRGQLARQWAPAAVAAQRAIKDALDPKGLLNPGKKLP
ncbi:MAG TPA: FAD-linked oxidase C-terminal domain-containing protein [Solirubrobacteraceae bacterium]|nr:FAD-linked oxidase C-terminal domain-containing protein [Solirubrobacteraceae bacterium]